MQRVELKKPDGRRLFLYAREALDVGGGAPSPFAQPLASGGAHLRWHPLRSEWVTYAPFRQDRTFLPPPQYDPLAATRDPAAPTELPAGNWEVAVFENRFPALGWQEPPPGLIVPTASARGRCEVVVYTPDASTSLGALPLAHIDLLIQVWAERSVALGSQSDVQYVLPFENRGTEIGATLHHPHGQIYAYPVVPPVPARMQHIAEEHYARTGRGPLDVLIEAEIASGERLLYQGPDAVAFVPVCARYPYEVWVAPRAPVAGFHQLSEAQRADLARALKTVLLKYDGLWSRSMPYLMAWYQAACDGRDHPEAHLHAQFYPPYRNRERLKYLAGTEIAAGFFAMDALPEEKAHELQAVEVTLS